MSRCNGGLGEPHHCHRDAIGVSVYCAFCDPAKPSAVECRSEDGITVGLIDTILNCALLLSGRDQSAQCVRDALQDLRTCKEMRDAMRSYELNELQICQENAGLHEKEITRLNKALREALSRR